MTPTLPDDTSETSLVDVLVEDERWYPDLNRVAGPAVMATLSRLDLRATDYSISLLGCSDDRIATLNEQFRGKPAPTNVLSWPAYDLDADSPGGTPHPPRPDIPGEPCELGDIAIAFETCAREAAEAGKPFRNHVTHLVVHGTLHLLGYDHITDEDAALMEGLETGILATLAIPDPYR